MARRKRLFAATTTLGVVVMALAAATGGARVAQVSSYAEPVEPHRGPLSPSIGASASGRELVTWAAADPSDDANDDRRLWGRYVGNDGRPDGSEFLISRRIIDGNPVYVADSKVAARGRRAEFLVVWEQKVLENSSYRHAIVGRRFDARGNPLSDEFPVSPPEFGFALSPQVIYRPQAREFLVTWSGSATRLAHEGGGEIYGSRIRAGSSHSRDPFQISFQGTATDEYGAGGAILAYDSKRSRYLVAWGGVPEGFRTAATYAYFRTLRGRGTSLGPKRRVWLGGQSVDDIAYSRRADRYVATWSAPGADESRVLALKLRPGGRPIGKPALIAGEGVPEDRLETAFTPEVEPRPRDGYLVIFGGSGNPEGERDGLYYRGVGADLERGPLAEVGSQAEDSRYSHLIFSDAKSIFRVVWTQGPMRADDDFDPLTPPPPPPPRNVFVRSLSVKASSR